MIKIKNIEKNIVNLEKLIKETDLKEILNGSIEGVKKKHVEFVSAFECLTPGYYDQLSIGHSHWFIIGEASDIYEKLDDKLYEIQR